MTDRDHQIVIAVGRFGRLSTGQIRSLFFEGNSSKNACYRRLKRLTELKYLAQTERPLIGGNKGGSGQYIYQLGPQGKKLFEHGFYARPRMTDIRHTLAIADAFIALKRLEAGGRYKVAGYATEPDTWETVAGVELRPDLHIELDDYGLRRSLGWWIEVDLSNERQKAIKDKMNDYYHAYQYSTAESIPLVVFLVPSERRAEELRWLISHQPADSRHLFTVVVQSGFPQALLAV